ncbi:MAG: bifunctional helix-turn-helix transcriptional regulator/GNAT family N-acetyltransferase, partial [Actinomycetota bacterium]
VRAFNRFYTNVIGVLHEGLVSTPYSLTEARVIFELAQRDSTEVADLRRMLDIDAGYLSRILARFEADGLADRERSISDGRRQVIRLTGHGRRVFRMLDKRSTQEIGNLLSPLTDEQQRRLVGAMRAIEDSLDGSRSATSLVLRAPGPGDFGWVVHRHGVIYAEEYGWDESFEALVARIVADYVDHHDPQREAAWIAEVHGEPVGCVFCVKKDEKVAQLRLLLVEAAARGMSIGSRLVEECIRFARGSGYERMMLWTNDVLEDASRIYEKCGFRLTEEEKHHSFGHDLVGQNWWLNL